MISVLYPYLIFCSDVTSVMQSLSASPMQEDGNIGSLMSLTVKSVKCRFDAAANRVFLLPDSRLVSTSGPSRAGLS